jgi:hypothetical protein
VILNYDSGGICEEATVTYYNVLSERAEENHKNPAWNIGSRSEFETVNLPPASEAKNWLGEERSRDIGIGQTCGISENIIWACNCTQLISEYGF